MKVKAVVAQVVRTKRTRAATSSERRSARNTLSAAERSTKGRQSAIRSEGVNPVPSGRDYDGADAINFASRKFELKTAPS